MTGASTRSFSRPSTGQLYLWFLNGRAYTNGAYLTPSTFADATWLPVP